MTGTGTASRHGVALLGLGYWGPNLLRNFVSNARFQVRRAVDLREGLLAPLRLRYPGVEFGGDPEAVWNDPDVELVAIATPVDSHHALALRALEAGKHVLVTKPLTANTAQAEELVAAARQRGRRLLTEHTFLFTPAVRRIRELVAAGRLGELYYVDSTRINLGLIQSDVNVLWDLACHDLSILLHVLGRSPRSVLATGASHTASGQVDVAHLSLHFDDKLLAHVHASWLSPVKVRQMIFGGSRQSLIYNDLNQAEKLRICDYGVDVQAVHDEETDRKLRIEYRVGDILLPAIPQQEALAVETEHIADVLDGRAEPVSNGELGLQIVRILEAAQRSLEEGFRVVEL